MRWLTLLALAMSLAMSDRLVGELIFVFLAIATWNVFLTVLTAANRRLSWQRPAAVAGDALAAYILFFMSDVNGGNLAWAGILPLIPAALYFNMRGVLGITLLNLAVQTPLIFLNQTQNAALVFVATIGPLYLLTGLFLSMMGRQMLRAASGMKNGNGDLGDRDRQVIYNMISAMSSTLNYQRVLETALDLSTTALASTPDESERLVSAVLLFQAGKDKTKISAMQVASARHFSQSDLRVELEAKQGLLNDAIDAGAPLLCEAITKDPELGRIVAFHNCKPAYCIPLRAGLETYGVLLFAHPDAGFFTLERREVLDMVGNQAVVAMQNARLYQDLEQEKERMMEIQEEARKKMARDLHDGPTQSVAAIAMRVNFARRLMERDAKAAAEELYKIEELARRTTKEIRHMLFTLRPLVLESQGLIAAFQSMSEKMRETYCQDVIIQADPKVASELEMGKQGVIFYIAEEAVNNARKHAKAEHIWVRLKQYGTDIVILEIEDNGEGFDVNAVNESYENRGSLGMVNMRERSELVNGVLHIDSAHGRGTLIQVAIPLTEDAAERLRRGA